MAQNQSDTTVNLNLLGWCGLVFIELWIIAYLIRFFPVILFSIVLFWPVRAALDWPVELPDQKNLPEPESDKKEEQNAGEMFSQESSADDNGESNGKD